MEQSPNALEIWRQNRRYLAIIGSMFLLRLLIKQIEADVQDGRDANIALLKALSELETLEKKP